MIVRCVPPLIFPLDALLIGHYIGSLGVVLHRSKRGADHELVHERRDCARRGRGRFSLKGGYGCLLGLSLCGHSSGCLLHRTRLRSERRHWLLPSKPCIFVSRIFGHFALVLHVILVVPPRTIAAILHYIIIPPHLQWILFICYSSLVYLFPKIAHDSCHVGSTTEWLYSGVVSA